MNAEATIRDALAQARRIARDILGPEVSEKAILAVFARLSEERQMMRALLDEEADAYTTH